MYMDCKVRLLELNIKNLKNIGSGVITFNSLNNINKCDFDFESSDIIGVYGPNGSSKSSLIDSLTILKKIFTNKTLEDEYFDYISILSDEMFIKLSLYCCVKKIHYIIEYSISISKFGENSVKITHEKIDYKYYVDGAWTNQRTLFEVNNNEDNDNFITPKQNLNYLLKNNKKLLLDLCVLKGKKESNKLSFLFSEEFCNILFNNYEYNFFSYILKTLNIYFNFCYHLYDNKEISSIVAKNLIPFFYKEECGDGVNGVYGNLCLNKDSYIKECHLNSVKNSIKNINLILSKIIPDLEIYLDDLSKSKDENGELIVNYILMSKRPKYNIPLKFESDGIKKIISILFSLVDAFNNPFAILIIDEFDSGIYEFLLGVILDIFKEKGYGQFLFTSHNLRALEVLKDDIVFTTIDENNRFSRIKYLKPTNNLRNIYLRNLYLKKDDELGINIDEYDIYRALIKAGVIFKYGEEEQ